MCGRFHETIDHRDLLRLFGLLADTPDPRAHPGPQFNIAPTHDILVVRDGGDARRLDTVRWGLTPSWWRKPKPATFLNARAETVHEKPSFRSAFRKRRVLVPADGWYEWRTEAGAKQPYRIHRADGGGFAFAGITSRWKGQDPPLDTGAILTTEAAPALAGVHDRMPVVLPQDAWDAWLDDATPEEDLRALLRPAEGVDWSVDAVHPKMGRVQEQGPGVWDPPPG